MENNVSVYIMGLALILMLPLAISSPLAGGAGTCNFPGAGGANAVKKFEDKHFSNAIANEANAKEKSCERMAVPNLRPGGAAASNTVLFDEISAGFVDPYYYGIQEKDPACGKEFNDLFVCDNVPKTHNNKNDCLAAGHHNGMVCKSCKVKYTDAKTFFVDVKTKNGHLDFKYVYYITASGWWQKFDTTSCLTP